MLRRSTLERPTLRRRLAITAVSVLGFWGLAAPAGAAKPNPVCGNGVAEPGEACDPGSNGPADLRANTCQSLGLGSGTLTCSSFCRYNTSGCRPYAFPATGQTTSSVAGDDGDVRAGAPLSYTDNQDGTITDDNTGLTWEKKTFFGPYPDAADAHNASNCYPWLGNCSLVEAFCGTDADCGPAGGTCDTQDCQTDFPDGMTVFEWVAALNTQNFAGHNDWRLPNLKELMTIVDYGTNTPSIDPAFGPTALPENTVRFSAVDYYWSSTTYDGRSDRAWGILFDGGSSSVLGKREAGFVRAVRGGLN